MIEARHNLRRVPDDKFRVLDAIRPGVVLCVADSRRYYFDSVSFARFPREKERYRSRAAIGVNDRFPASKARVFQRFSIQYRRLRRIDLKKRPGRDLKGKRTYRVANGALPP